MTHTHTHTPTHTHTYHCVIDTLVIVTDTHKHIDRVLCTYMTSYLPQVYRLSILIDKETLFINSWLIRLSVDNVLLINTEGYFPLWKCFRRTFQFGKRECVGEKNSEEIVRIRVRTTYTSMDYYNIVSKTGLKKSNT
jgi:hypothetical protein